MTQNWDPRRAYNTTAQPRSDIGRFSEKGQSSPELTLVAPQATPDFVGAFIDGYELEEFNLSEVQAVLDTLNATRNFSDANVANALTGVLRKRRDTVQDTLDEIESQLERLERPIRRAPGAAVAATPGNPPTGVNNTSAVAFDDPRVQAGEVFDTVVGPDGTFFHRRRDDIYPDMCDAFRIQTSVAVDDDEMRQLAGLIGYSFRTLGGEPMSDPVRDSPYSFILGSDATKGSGDFDKFEQALPELIANGSPIRTTDRAGAGTRGTRLIDGLGDGITYNLYYDAI